MRTHTYESFYVHGNVPRLLACNSYFFVQQHIVALSSSQCQGQDDPHHAEHP